MFFRQKRSATKETLATEGTQEQKNIFFRQKNRRTYFLDRKTEDNKNKNLHKSNITDRRQRRMARRGSGTKTTEKIRPVRLKRFVVDG